MKCGVIAVPNIVRFGFGGQLITFLRVPIVFWFGSREAENFNMLQKLLAPLNIVMNYVDGNWAYVDNILAEKLTGSKKFTQNIERKHLSRRTWCSRWVRRGIRFSKSEECTK